MSLSIYTSPSSMAASNNLHKSNSILSTAMERLGTGKRINSAADDAAGLQIATRLDSQFRGMGVAQRNISDGIALLQTAEGAFDEITNILHRMKDLSTQAANGTNSSKDLEAMQSEFSALNTEIANIMGNTSFAGELLFKDKPDVAGPPVVPGAKGKLTQELKLQIGATKEEVMTISVGTALTGLKDKIDYLSGSDLKQTADATKNANALITKVAEAIDGVSAMRSNLGASINRLNYTSANLAHMQDNTNLAKGNIVDADYAEEASKMTRNQMLTQTSMSMLKQSNSMSGMVMSLLG